jgi:heme oxygenase
MKSHNASEQISLVTKVSELEAYTMNLHNEVDTLVTSKKTEISQKLNELSAYKLSTSKMFE